MRKKNLIFIFHLQSKCFIVFYVVFTINSSSTPNIGTSNATIAVSSAAVLQSITTNTPSVTTNVSSNTTSITASYGWVNNIIYYYFRCDSLYLSKLFESTYYIHSLVFDVLILFCYRHPPQAGSFAVVPSSNRNTANNSFTTAVVQQGGSQPIRFNPLVVDGNKDSDGLLPKQLCQQVGNSHFWRFFHRKFGWTPICSGIWWKDLRNQKKIRDFHLI